MREKSEENKVWKPWANFKPLEGGTTEDIIRAVCKLNKKVAAQRKKLSRFFT